METTIQPKVTGNPWGLTPAEVKAVETLIETDNFKMAGRRLGLSHLTIRAAAAHARRKIGMPGRLRYLIAYDRWSREQRIAPWLSAALEDPATCSEFKTDIVAWLKPAQDYDLRRTTP